MAKTRFRRKSHGKKNKTVRRQKRQSRRMRGGENRITAINEARVTGCEKFLVKGKDPEYNVEVALNLSDIQNKTDHEVMKLVKTKSSRLGKNIGSVGINDVEYLSNCGK